MKKRVSACLAVLMALLPNTVLAAEEIDSPSPDDLRHGARGRLLGAGRLLGSVFDAGVHLERQAQARPAECEPDDGARGARKDT